MTEQDKIKTSALKKFYKYVEFEIGVLRDRGLSLSDFKFEPTKDYFTEEELKEIRRNIESIKTKEGLVDHCFNNSIDLSSFKK